MTIRRKTPRQPDVALTPGLRFVLEIGADMLGEFRELDLTEAQLEKKLEELWRVHHREVLAQWIKKNPGTRPALWWRYSTPTGAGRPIVRPANGSPEDARRFHEERTVADLRFLISHKLLTRGEEREILAQEKSRNKLLAES